MGAFHCFFLLEVNLDEMPLGAFFWKHGHMVESNEDSLAECLADLLTK